MSIDTSVGRVEGVRVSIDTSVQVSGQGSGVASPSQDVADGSRMGRRPSRARRRVSPMGRGRVAGSRGLSPMGQEWRL